jgi:hypothetical protein
MAEKQAPNDQELVDYLLGALSKDDCERLDELSVTDDSFASRLRAVENDLVDSYARGELSGSTLQRFRSFYLSSPKREEKTRFAEAFLALGEKTLAETRSATSALQARSPEAVGFWAGIWRVFSSSGPLQWGLAAAAILMTVASATLLVQQLQFRNSLAQSQAERAALLERERELQGQLEQQRTADAKTQEELQHLRQSLAEIEQRSTPKTELNIASFVLLPAMRGVGKLPTISIPKGIEEVALFLELESDDFSRYGVKLKDNATGRTLWQSVRLRATSSGETKGVTVALPAGFLKSQLYGIELSGISSGGRSEFLSSYTFRVVLE